MDLLTKKRSVPLDALLDEPTFILRGVWAKKAYSDGKPTDDICGYTYEVFNTKTIELIRVTVTQSAPIVSNQEIADSLENGTPIVVEFRNAKIKFYMPKDSRQYAESITADGISLVTRD